MKSRPQPEPLTDAEVAEAQARCDAATPKQVKQGSRNFNKTVVFGVNDDGTVEAVIASFKDPRDASFYVVARTDLPRALERIRQQASELEALRRILGVDRQWSESAARMVKEAQCPAQR